MYQDTDLWSSTLDFMIFDINIIEIENANL